VALSQGRAAVATLSQPSQIVDESFLSVRLRFCLVRLQPFWQISQGFPMSRPNLLSALMLLLCAATGFSQEPAPVPLFDGQTLAGFHKEGGGATYEIENGEIVGKVGPGANTFLCTEKTYGDFRLKVDVKLDVPGNSGIQIRSHMRKEKNGTNRVFGYQCEIDPSDRAWTAGIYDEGRRGWLYPLTGNEAARAAFKKTEWNAFEILAVGPSIKTWVNGIPCADLIDTMDLEGLIALQVHSGKAGQIRWKNILLTDLGRREWVPLFNGQTFGNWQKFGAGNWAIEDGVLHGTHKADEVEYGHLVSGTHYSDFMLRVEYKAKAGNSGVYIRTEVGGDKGVKGIQAEIDPLKDAGGLFETDGRGWLVQPKAEDVKKWYKPNDWNEMTVVAIGPRLVVHLNGHRSAEVKNDPSRPSGVIALQLHGRQDCDIQFRKVEIVDLRNPAK